MLTKTTDRFSLVGVHHGFDGHKAKDRSLHSVEQRLLPVDGASDRRLIFVDGRILSRLFKQRVHQVDLRNNTDFHSNDPSELSPTALP